MSAHSWPGVKYILSWLLNKFMSGSALPFVGNFYMYLQILFKYRPNTTLFVIFSSNTQNVCIQIQIQIQRQICILTQPWCLLWIFPIWDCLTFPDFTYTVRITPIPQLSVHPRMTILNNLSLVLTTTKVTTKKSSHESTWANKWSRKYRSL